MFKIITCLFFFCICISAQVQYDPITGKPVEQKKFNPNTGEEIKQKFDPNTGNLIEIKKEGMTAKVILNSGDTIKGRLVSQDREKVIIESEATGMVSIGRSNIKSMSINGVPLSSRRPTRAPVVRENTFTNNQTLAVRAKNEAIKKNERRFNTVVGTGACLLAPYITLPLMGIAIAGDMGVTDPESKYYNELDPKLKKQYRTIYKKETKKLRTKQCFAPTLAVGAAAAIMIGLVIFSGV